MPLYKAQQITKDCFAQEMTEMAEIMMWFFEFRFWVLPLQLPKKREAFTSSSCTGLVRCLHQPNLRVQWLCCNSEILI